MFESRDSTHPGYSSHATLPLTLPSHFYHGATELAISAHYFKHLCIISPLTQEILPLASCRSSLFPLDYLSRCTDINSSSSKFDALICHQGKHCEEEKDVTLLWPSTGANAKALKKNRLENEVQTLLLEITQKKLSFGSRDWTSLALFFKTLFCIFLLHYDKTLRNIFNKILHINP